MRIGLQRRLVVASPRQHNAWVRPARRRLTLQAGAVLERRNRLRRVPQLQGIMQLVQRP
jgi:hypothetical protein